MSEINDTLKEALKSDMAVIVYQTDKGPAVGFIETTAITKALAETVNGEDKYGAAIVTAVGGHVDKADDLIEALTSSLVGTWGQIRETFVR